MLLHIIARGKIARSPEAELVARYEKRITWPIRVTELPETGGKIPDPLSPHRTVLLDERGKDLTSREFAGVLERWRDEGVREARFVLGAADGHSREEREEAEVPIDDDERALAERNTGDDRLDEKVGKDRCGNRRIVVGHSTILPGAALVSLHRH